MSTRKGLRGCMNSAVVRKRSAEHLDPLHETHKADQRKAKAAREQLAQSVPVSVAPAETLKFPSLAGGKRLDKHGRELSPEDCQAAIEAAQGRSFYYADYKKRDGTTSQRKCPTKPVHQAAISYFPAYDLAFSRLERLGLGIAPVIRDHSQVLIHEFTAATGYEVIAATVHPEEGNLHHHLLWTHVNEEHQLLHGRSGRGRRGPRFLGPALTGTLRLVDKGIWPEEDAFMARKFFADRIRGGQEPVDWVLSQVLDGLAEKTLSGLSAAFPWVKDVWDGAEKDYRQTVLARRAARPDLLAERLTSLEDENASLRAEIERLRATPKPPDRSIVPPMRGSRSPGDTNRMGM